MAETDSKTFTASDARKIAAHQLVHEYGPGGINPLIGQSAAETCGRVEEVIALLHRLAESDSDLEENRPAVASLLGSVWTAVQYERDVGQH